MRKDADIMMEKLYFRLDNTPLFVTDGLNFYKKALLKIYGIKKKHENPFDRRLKRPAKTVPPDDLCYAQVIKTVEGKKLVNVERRVIFGDVDENDITTSFVERLNLTFRQEMKRFARKTVGASKNINHLTAHFSFFARYYNFCRTHMSHKIRGMEYATPAMAAGVTKEIWSIRKLLFFPIEITSTNYDYTTPWSDSITSGFPYLRKHSYNISRTSSVVDVLRISDDNTFPE